jgi:hypothetical protein
MIENHPGGGSLAFSAIVRKTGVTMYVTGTGVDVAVYLRKNINKDDIRRIADKHEFGLEDSNAEEAYILANHYIDAGEIKSVMEMIGDICAL